MKDLTNLRNDPDAVAIDNGNSYHLLAVWRHPRDEAFSPLWEIALAARTAVANMLDRLENVRQNDRLSDRAKQEDEREIARRTLADLGEQQRRLNKATDDLNAKRMRLAEVPPADAAQATVDVAIASFFRELTGDARSALLAEMVAGSQPRIVEALLRLPTVMFGITEKLAATIEGNAIVRRAPEQARHLQQMDEALSTAQLALTRAVALVNDSSGLTLEDRMVSLGSGAWQAHVKDGAPGALAALARRFGVTESA